MIKKIYMLTYFIIVFSLFSIGYTSSYFLDIEQSSSSCSLTAGEWLDCMPYKPTNPNPAYNALDIDLNPTLSVYVSDANGDVMDVSFYNAFDNSLINRVENTDSNTTVSIVWPNLDYEITYEWYVIAEDYEGPTQSDTWKFTTKSKPKKPDLISPVNNSQYNDISPVLKVQVFNSDDKTMNVTFYDASNNQYIGQRVNIENGKNASITWTNLRYNQKYSWYLIINDSKIETKSDTWCFTTKIAPSINSGSGETSSNTQGSSSSSSNQQTNTPPIADTNGPYQGKVLENILFNGSKSYDTDGNIALYYWDFGDGKNSTDTNATVTHQYTDVGTYKLILTVTDNNGLKNTNSSNVTITSSVLEIKNIAAIPQSQNLDEQVNITCSLTKFSEIIEVILNIKRPDGSVRIISMVHTNNTNTYYYNSKYSDIGGYKYFIYATDIDKNTVKSANYYFLIKDLQPPIIIDNTPEIGYKNDSITFKAIVEDNDIVSNTYIEYWYETDNHSNLSMNNINEDVWEKTITNTSNHEILNYIIHAKDASNNWNNTEINSIILLEKT